jgi:Protein of unknown function (DUF3618)
VPEAARTPAEIEARIDRRRRDLAATLDEIAIRVHPRTIVGDAKARAAEAVDRGVVGVRGQFVSPDGRPRLERVIPVAVLTIAVAGLLVTRSSRRRRR